VAQTLLEQSPTLSGQVVTADALHAQRSTARKIVEKGGEYLLQIKANQKRLFKLAQKFDALKDTPFLSRPKPATDASKPAACMPSPSNRCGPTSPLPAA
jgi:hypothetical protein